MWTGLGALFVIAVIGFPILSTVATLFFGSALKASGAKKAKEASEKANQALAKLSGYSNVRIMSQSDRKTFLRQEPTSVVIGRESISCYRNDYVKGRVPINVIRKKYWSYEDMPFHLEFIYEKNEDTPFRIPDYTDDIYTYIKNIEFVGDTSERDWIDRYNKRYGRYSADESEYYRARSQQCEQYCRAISMLAYRYIYFGEYKEFKNAFIQILIGDRELALQFVRECHAANVWREQNMQIYDCDNYMKDFMEENDILDRVEMFMGHEVQIPDDFRHLREDTPSPYACKRIEHDLEKRSRIGLAERTDYKVSHWYGGWFLTMVASIFVWWWILGTPTEESIRGLKQLAVFLDLLALGVVGAIAVSGNNYADRVREEDKKDKTYYDSFPERTEEAGDKYGTEIYFEIIRRRPRSYKYHNLTEYVPLGKE